jgi:hypothetical protein
VTALPDAVVGDRHTGAIAVVPMTGYLELHECGG